MSLYHKDKFDIIVKEVVEKTRFVIEIDQHGIIIKSEGSGHTIYIEKKHFEQIIKKWNLFHHS